MVTENFESYCCYNFHRSLSDEVTWEIIVESFTHLTVEIQVPISFKVTFNISPSSGLKCNINNNPNLINTDCCFLIS